MTARSSRFTVTLLAATSNPGKLRELRDALEPCGIDVVGLDALPDITPIEETGTTFEENARLKAIAYSHCTALPVLADDSGLEVDALGGAPGVLSARFGGEGLDDAGRCALLLDRLAGSPLERRTARFRCVLAVARAGAVLGTFEGVVEGVITDAPRGTAGFGYDPVFFHPPSRRTFAELSVAEKRAVSHRGAATRELARASQEGRLVLG